MAGSETATGPLTVSVVHYIDSDKRMVYMYPPRTYGIGLP